jgi:hypothetical protein
MYYETGGGGSGGGTTCTRYVTGQCPPDCFECGGSLY